MAVTITHLSSGDVHLLEALLVTFAEAFSDAETYSAKPPKKAYLQNLLEGDSLIVVVAMENDKVVGGVAAYELKKFEQERSEVYIYDLAVASDYRRRGIATVLIEHLKRIAAERGAYVMFVQADTDVEDEPAIALYTNLGSPENVLHFDIAVDDSKNSV